MAGINKKEYDLISDPTERFLIRLYDTKHFMGRWYSLFALRILPFLLFFIPINVIAGRVFVFSQRIFDNFLATGTMFLVTWIVSLSIFVIMTIFAPKVATVMEFVIGIAYLIIVFHYHLYNTWLGYLILFGMILFLLVKLVFLVFEIIRIRTFAKDGEGVERDESGRIVRATEEEVYFTEEETEGEENAVAADEKIVYTEDDENEGYEYETNTDEKLAYTDDDTEGYEYETASDEDVLYTEETDDYEPAASINEEVVFFDGDDEQEREVILTDDIVFIDEDMNANNEPVAAVNEEIFFVSGDEEITGEGKISESDNDYFFG